MRDVAIVSFAQRVNVRREVELNEVEMLMPVISEAIEQSGIPRKEIGFTVSGSTDFLSGLAFAFVGALDAVGAWPPISESHVEMDGAWALYEAWVRLQHGDIDSALVFSFGKSSSSELRDVLVTQLDPYYMAPLRPDSVSVAALQARAYLETTGKTEQALAEVAVRNRRNGLANQNAQVTGNFSAEQLLRDPYLVSPLRKHDCPPITDGASAMILAAGDLARKVCQRTGKRPAWIRGIDHRIEAHGLGMRDLTRSPSTRLAAERAGALTGHFDIAELHAPFTHQELILQDALNLDSSVQINPSGGALCANAVMVAGLTRIGEAVARIQDGSASRALAHATSGPCLQHNLVCVLEAE